MKSLIKIICFLIFSFRIGAQTPVWEEQQSGTTNHLNDIYFLSEDLGYVVGEAGTVLKTNDGGENWVVLNTGLPENFNTLWFFDENTGFIAGNGGNSLYKTTNAGITWSPILHSLTTQPWEELLSIYFTDQNVGFVGATNGFMRTLDGGVSWTNIGTYTSIEKIDFYDNNIGYAVSNEGVLKTINGGLNWSIIKSPGDTDFSNGAIIQSIQAMSVDTVYFGAPYYSAFYTSFNGGASLNYQQISISDLIFTNSATGFAISISANLDLTIMKTTDSGDTWNTQFQTPAVDPNELATLWMHDENEGWAAGNNGNIRHLKMSNTNSIEEIEQLQITVFPNPVTSVLHIKENHLTIDILLVMDTSGKTCAINPNGESSIDVSLLNAGKYFLQIISEGKTITTSFLKE